MSSTLNTFILFNTFVNRTRLTHFFMTLLYRIALTAGFSRHAFITKFLPLFSTPLLLPSIRRPRLLPPDDVPRPPTALASIIQPLTESMETSVHASAHSCYHETAITRHGLHILRTSSSPAIHETIVLSEDLISVLPRVLQSMQHESHRHD
jgi:hypothetical protein